MVVGETHHFWKPPCDDIQTWDPLNIRPPTPAPGAPGLDHQRWGGHSEGATETRQRFEERAARRGDGSWSGNPLPQKIFTLQGINISHLGKRKIIFKMPFLGDMLVPWRVNLTSNQHNEHYNKEWEVVSWLKDLDTCDEELILAHIL